MFRSKALRPIAGIVLVTFTALTLQPLTAAAQLPSAPSRAQVSSDSSEERFSRTLNEIHEILKEVVPQAAMPHMFRSAAPTAAGKPGEKVLQAVGPKMRLETERAKPLPGVDVTAKVKTLRGKYKELKGLEAEVTKGFKATEKHIRDKNLPAEILVRHEQAVAEYERRKAEFNTLMQAVETAADGKGELQPALASLGEFMAKYPNAKTHTPTDPNNLPWGSPKPVTRAPYTSPAQFKTSRLFGEPVKVAQAGSLSGISLPTTVLPLTPTPADLAPTEDVQITQAIRDLVASLGNKPVPIYNWVRNNIQFIPSYGSIQGSDMTLQTKRGNAFDTASLLIALLRAANVPARYVYGTIEVPADKAMNWVGGVTVPQAAQNLMGQGGIPNVGVGFAGQIRSIRLEHVWVEAYVDYVPSRGAVNRNPNTWVPLDASFKQYEFTQGMDVKTNVPFDAQSFMTQIQQGITVNDAEGWVQNVSQTQIQQALTNYQTQVANYVNAQKQNATVGDVLGTQTIVQENRAIFLGTLPYKRIATGAKFQAIPDNLRWKFRYNVYANDTDRAFDNPFINYTQSTPSVAGKKITLSFSPATLADQTTINSFLPTPHADGSPTQLSELPQSLPGYLVQMMPKLTIAGQLVASGAGFPMGTELIQYAALYDPSKGWQAGGDNRHIVGEYIVTAVELVGTTRDLILGHRNKLVDTSNKLNSLTPQIITPEDITGDILYSAILLYFATSNISGQISANISGVVEFIQPSFGSFSASAFSKYYFGIPRAVVFSGLTMDLDRLTIIVASKDGDSNKATRYNEMRGQGLSANENVIPERLFTDGAFPGSGVSAVKLLGLASNQGQRIYSITSQNVDLVLPQVNLNPALRAEIQNAVLSGNEVRVHSSGVTVGSWTGFGYIILDSLSGSGAYKISGGPNGGFTSFISAVLAQPNLLIPECKGSFFSTFLSNFEIAFGTIPGLLLPLGATFFTAGAMAEFLGGITILAALSLFFIVNPIVFAGILLGAIVVAIVNWLFFNAVFLIGLVLGALLGAAICRRPN